MVKNACHQTINVDLTDGWNVNDDSKLVIDYFSGDPYPANISEITSNINSNDNDEGEDDYIESDDSDIFDSDNE